VIKPILAIFVALAVIGSATATPPGFLGLAFVVATDGDVRAPFPETRHKDLICVTQGEDTIKRMNLACNRLVIDRYGVDGIAFEATLGTATADMMQTLRRLGLGIYLAGPFERQQISREYIKADGIRKDLESACQRYAYDNPAKAQCEANLL